MGRPLGGLWQSPPHRGNDGGGGGRARREQMSESVGGGRSGIQLWSGCGMRGRRRQGCLPRRRGPHDDGPGERSRLAGESG